MVSLLGFNKGAKKNKNKENIKEIKTCIECGTNKANYWEYSFCEECFKEVLGVEKEDK